MKNQALERAIDALGGPTPTSHALVVSYWTIRTWRKAGRIRDSRYAVLLARAAQAVGVDVTVDELAGVKVIDGNGGDPPKGGKMSATYPDPRVARAAARQVTRRAETSVLRAA